LHLTKNNELVLFWAARTYASTTSFREEGHHALSTVISSNQLLHERQKWEPSQGRNTNLVADLHTQNTLMWPHAAERQRDFLEYIKEGRHN